MALMTEDWDLLQQFVQSGSQEAFGKIVARYLDLVYSAARRQVRADAIAQDVAQAVFIILFRKAGQLRRNTILPAWLLRTTSYAAKNALRSEQRRQQHEQQAGRMRATITCSTDPQAWEQIAPMLDEAMD